MRYPGRYYKGIVISKILEIMIPLLCEFCYSKDRKYHKAPKAAEIPAFHSPSVLFFDFII